MDTSALREFAFKKLQEARERGTELAAATAARAASSISSSTPASSSFAFRSATQQEQLPMAPEHKLETLKTLNDSLRTSLTGSSSGILDKSINKLDLINESLAYTIENIQEASHVMKLLNRQLKDSAAMQNSAHKTFHQRRPQ